MSKFEQGIARGFFNLSKHYRDACDFRLIFNDTPQLDMLLAFDITDNYLIVLVNVTGIVKLAQPHNISEKSTRVLTECLGHYLLNFLKFSQEIDINIPAGLFNKVLIRRYLRKEDVLLGEITKVDIYLGYEGRYIHPKRLFR